MPRRGNQARLVFSGEEVAPSRANYFFMSADTNQISPRKGLWRVAVNHIIGVTVGVHVTMDKTHHFASSQRGELWQKEHRLELTHQTSPVAYSPPAACRTQIVTFRIIGGGGLGNYDSRVENRRERKLGDRQTGGRAWTESEGRYYH